MTARGASAAAVAALLGLLAGGAAAQPADPYLEGGRSREGWMIGLAPGVAAFSGRGDYGRGTNFGASGALRLGVTAGDRLLWLFEFQGLQLGGPNVSDAIAISTVGPRYFVRDRLWIGGGVGVSAVTEAEPGSARNRTVASGVGSTASAGIDLWTSGFWSIDLEAGVAAGLNRNGGIGMFSIRVAVNHY